jgi:hypothetical protein
MLNKKILELYEKAGFSHESAEGKWPNIYSIGRPLEELVRLVVEECAVAAENTARGFSDGDAGVGSKSAANAVRYYGESLLK